MNKGKKTTQVFEEDDRIHFGVRAGSPTSTLFSFLGGDFQIQECVWDDIFFLLLFAWSPPALRCLPRHLRNAHRSGESPGGAGRSAAPVAAPPLSPPSCATPRTGCPRHGHRERPQRELAPSHRTSWPWQIKCNTVALQRGQPCRFWREPRQKGEEGKRRKLRAPAPLQTLPGPGSRQSRSGGSQRQRRVPPAGQRRSVRRPPPRPAAPAHLSATGSAHLPPSLPLSRSGCWWRPRALRLGGCPALFLPQPAAAPAVTSPPHPAGGGGGGSGCS